MRSVSSSWLSSFLKHVHRFSILLPRQRPFISPAAGGVTASVPEREGRRMEKEQPNKDRILGLRTRMLDFAFIIQMISREMDSLVHLRLKFINSPGLQWLEEASDCFEWCP